MKSADDNTRALPYGSWPSPVSAAMVAGKSLRLGQPCIDGGTVYWLETRPQEGGRTTLVCWTREHGCRDLLPVEYSIQSRMHGYGGGAYAVHGGNAWFVNKHDQCIYTLRAGEASLLAGNGQRHFADLVYDSTRHRLLAVSEQFDDTGVRTSIVSIDCSDGSLATLVEGNDFYSSPRLSPDGRRLAWIEWQFPDMPWDTTRLFIAELDSPGMPGAARHIAGDGESVVQPLWRDNDELLFASDRSDWWNLYAWKDGEVRCLHAAEAEFALPHWIFGIRTFDLLDRNRLVCAYTRNGIWRLAELNLHNGEWRQHELPFSQIDHVHAENGAVVLQAAAADKAASILRLGNSSRAEVLRQAAETDLDPAFLAPPEPITFSTGSGEQAHALYYAPANPRCTAPENETPPLLVKVHGGPTSATSSALDMKIRFWTSRGFAVLDVNYRGSTGYGRKYRHSLYGRWGVADVEDAINGARALAERGQADRKRLLISGSSAGGLTVLSALTFHDVFAAGASYYGVGDIAGVMQDTEKFESRYGDKLIGPLPETWRERSPLFHAERLNRPVIFFQGLEDRIVPPDQSRRMHAAARANGVDTFYIVFPDEGHGFRGAATIETALRAEYAFYCRVLGICASETLPVLEEIAVDRQPPD